MTKLHFIGGEKGGVGKSVEKVTIGEHGKALIKMGISQKSRPWRKIKHQCGKVLKFSSQLNICHIIHHLS